VLSKSNTPPPVFGNRTIKTRLVRSYIAQGNTTGSERKEAHEDAVHPNRGDQLVGVAEQRQSNAEDKPNNHYRSVWDWISADRRAEDDLHEKE
jgi:hypothetical protein